MTNLRDELRRIADDAPTVHVPHEVWERGRRARTRDRVVGAGAAAVAVAAALALAVGMGGWLRPAATPPPADGGPGTPGVPSRIWPVPQHLLEAPPGEAFGRVWVAEVAEDDLAVGRVSVAFGGGTDNEAAVVITARDGAYHPLVLPGYAADVAFMDEEANGLALSPAGTHLAYTWAEKAGRTDYSPVESGIRVVDLVSGEVVDVDLAEVTGDAQATLAARLVWSPNGRWLVWAGRRYQQYNASGSSSGGGPGVAGLVRLGSTRSRPLPEDFSNFPLAVTDDGLVLGATSGRNSAYAVWEDGAVRPLGEARARASSQWGRGVASPGGRYVQLPRSQPGRSVPVLDLRTGRVREAPVPRQQGRVVTQPLGWVGAELMAVQVSRTHEETAGSWTWEEPVVVLMSPPGTPASARTYRDVARWVRDEATPPAELSVAVDLLAGEHPTRDFPEPEWPPSDEELAATIATAVAAACLLLAAAYVVWRRRRA